MRISSEKGFFGQKWFIEFAGSKFKIPSREECLQIQSIYSVSVLSGNAVADIFDWTEAKREKKKIEDEQFHLSLLRKMYKEV